MGSSKIMFSPRYDVKLGFGEAMQKRPPNGHTTDRIAITPDQEDWDVYATQLR